MAIRGFAIIKTKDESRVCEISNFIWGLNFKKNLMVDIAIYVDEPYIRVKITRVRYIIYVNPNISLEDIKNYLLSNKYILEE